MSRRKPPPGIAQQEPDEPAEAPVERAMDHDSWCPDPERCPAARSGRRKDQDPRAVLNESPAEEAARGAAYFAVHFAHLRDKYGDDPTIPRPNLRPTPRNRKGK